MTCVGTNSTKTEVPLKINKRSVEAENTLQALDGAVEKLVGGDRCRLEAWRCVSGVMEGGVRFIDQPEGLWR